MTWACLTATGLVVAAQMVIAIASAAGGALTLMQGRFRACGRLVVATGIVARRLLGHVVGGVGFLVHEDVSIKGGKGRLGSVGAGADGPRESGLVEHRASGEKDV
jgi:hypothetical protein